MTIDEKLFEILTSPPAVAALGDRIYPIQAPQRVDDYYAVWQLITERPITTMENDPGGTRSWFYQFAVFGPEFATTKAAARDLLAFLVGYKDGPNGIQRITKIDLRDLQDPEPTRLYHSILEVNIFENLG